MTQKPKIDTGVNVLSLPNTYDPDVELKVRR